VAINVLDYITRFLGLSARLCPSNQVKWISSSFGSWSNEEPILHNALLYLPSIKWRSNALLYLPLIRRNNALLYLSLIKWRNIALGHLTLNKWTNNAHWGWHEPIQVVGLQSTHSHSPGDSDSFYFTVAITHKYTFHRVSIASSAARNNF
jgi:hypothetical protein